MQQTKLYRPLNKTELMQNKSLNIRQNHKQNVRQNWQYFESNATESQKVIWHVKNVRREKAILLFKLIKLN